MIKKKHSVHILINMPDNKALKKDEIVKFCMDSLVET